MCSAKKTDDLDCLLCCKQVDSISGEVCGLGWRENKTESLDLILKTEENTDSARVG